MSIVRPGSLLFLALLAAGSVLGQPPAAAPEQVTEALAEAPLPALVAALGFVPVPPVQLPTLSATEQAPSRGERRELAEMAQRWALITFVADWCEPCRSELVLLDELGERLDLALTVVLVEADDPEVAAEGAPGVVLLARDAADLERFGVAALPVTYLVAPGGRVVGLARGAVQGRPDEEGWSALARVAAEMRARGVPELSADVPEDPLSALEDVAGLPHLTVAAPATIEAQDPFELTVEISWPGGLDVYVPRPPRLPESEGLEVLDVSARSAGGADASTMEYVLELRPEGPGRLLTDPLTVELLSRSTGRLLAMRAEAPSLDVEPAPDSGGWIAAAALLVALSVGGVLGLRLRASGARTTDTSRVDVLDGALREARKARIEGDAAAVVEHWQVIARHPEIAADLAPEVLTEIDRLEEETRFGGVTPPAADLDRIQRLLERSLQHIRPDPEAAEREALHLPSTTPSGQDEAL